MNERTSKIETLSIFVHDSILVSEDIIITLIIERIKTFKVRLKERESVVSVEEYRQLLNDFTTSSERIEERVQYLEAFCRNIIKPELRKIYEQSKKNVL